MSEIISYILIGIGLLMIVIVVSGCSRLPDYFCKMHAATIGDCVGCPLILFGIAMQSDQALKISILALVLLIVNPASSYILNRIAMRFKKDA